jgi:hypothetical protein
MKMDPALQLIMEQLNRLSTGQDTLISGQEELKDKISTS